jgi:hypothetical protein
MLLQPEKAMYFLLAGNPAVARRVGFRIFPVAVPRTDFPFIVYKRANIARQGTMTNTPLFLPTMSIQVASWALSHDAARELADDVRLALDARTGTVLGITIEDMRLVSETDDYLDPATVGAQLPPAYEVRQLYQVMYQESAV